MTLSRQQICQATADALRKAAPNLPSMKAVLGFDGFVDEIISVVDKRHGPDDYEPVESIAAMARKILAASGESSNYELIVKHRKLGGNGPIMANALASLGLDVTYIGNLGYPTSTWSSATSPRKPTSSASPNQATPTHSNSTTASSCLARSSRSAT